METALLGLIDAENMDDAKKMVDEKLWKEEVNEEGLLTGEREEYNDEQGNLDREKVVSFIDRSKQACQLRIDEMNEAMCEGWEENLETMLDMPFAEVDALICQYILGMDHIRTPFQKLDDTIEYLERIYEEKKKQIGALPRPRKEGRGEDAVPNQEDLLKLQKAVKNLKADWFPEEFGHLRDDSGEPGQAA